MGLYKYTGEDERTYPGRSESFAPGDEADWDEAPDYRWKPLDNSDSTPTPEGSAEAQKVPSDAPVTPETPSEPEETTPEPDTTTEVNQ